MLTCTGVKKIDGVEGYYGYTQYGMLINSTVFGINSVNTKIIEQGLLRQLDEIAKLLSISIPFPPPLGGYEKASRVFILTSQAHIRAYL